MKNKTKKQISPVIIMIVLILFFILLIALSGYILSQAFKVSTDNLVDTYNDTYKRVAEETEQKIYDKVFQTAEKKYHVSNEIKLSIDNVKELSKLEVLKVSDVEFIMHEQSDDKFDAWVAIPGNGIYTIDMNMCDFLIDNERNIVVTRLPEPELTEIGVDHEHIEIYNHGSTIINNGNYSDGTDIADADLKEGEKLIEEEFRNNQEYFRQAKVSAENFMINWIKSLNSDNEDLKVVVEFMD